MKKNMVAIILIVILIIGGVFFYLKGNSKKENYSDKRIKLIVNGATLEVRLMNNASAEAFYEKLKDGHIIIEASDYGNFEKVGDLGYDLPTSDENITTSVGDIILYQGNKIAVYYAKNTYELTKIGKIQSTNASYLQTILGQGNVRLEFSL